MVQTNAEQNVITGKTEGQVTLPEFPPARRIHKATEVSEQWNQYKTTAQVTTPWSRIDWKRVHFEVTRSQHRIFGLTKRLREAKSNPEREKLSGNLKRRQTKHITSIWVTLHAVRRITQINTGKNTPGVDKFLITTDKERALLLGFIQKRVDIFHWLPAPTRRVMIGKPGSAEKRPLGIPTIIDRVLQYMILSALEPQVETNQDYGSHGFRPGYRCQDSIEKIFRTCTTKDNTLPRKQWVVQGDIKGCFDTISHQYLLEKLTNFPGKNTIEKWLKAGYLFEGQKYETDTGTPQGGIISPLLSNLCLNGLEADLRIRYREKADTNGGVRVTLDDYQTSSAQNPRRGFVRYADDFVVLCESEADAHWAKAELVVALRTRGLTLSEERTKITHITKGYNFLGFHIQSYKVEKINIPGGGTKSGYKLIIKPSEKSITSIKATLKEKFVKLRSSTTGQLIREVNQISRGWANYHRPNCASATFGALDSYLYELQRRYAARRHLNKGEAWKNEKYFGRYNPEHPKDRWVFANLDDPIGTEEPIKGTIDAKQRAKTKKRARRTKAPAFMQKFRWVSIRRHLPVNTGYSKCDPALSDWWQKRTAKTSESIGGMYDKLATRQKQICPLCSETLWNGEELHMHHVIPYAKGGTTTFGNLVLLHKMCHRATYGREEEFAPLFDGIIRPARLKEERAALKKASARGKS